MNLLNTALSQVSNLIPAQTITIENTTMQIVDGVARPLATQPIQAIAHIQPLTPQELRLIEEGLASAQEYYKAWIIGNDIQVIKMALEQNSSSEIVWNNKRYSVYSKQDWSLNGWIEVIFALRGENDA